jgi:uncharacterized protein YgbK (DUF1537 family)
LLLTTWEVETLKTALMDEPPLFFVLTNTRGMSADNAATLTRQVCQNLKVALDELSHTTSITPILVSRSDSTLRGHYPVEPNVIAETLGPFDAHFLVPAFFEGGRITRNSTHYLVVDGVEIACHDTEFAKDSVFGYSTAYLPDYVQEKTKGMIMANQVERFLLQDVRGDCSERLQHLTDNVCCVVDGEQQPDLDHFCTQIQQVAATHGRKFLFRSGASLLTALAQLPPQPVTAEDMADYVPKHRPGAILVGSHVQKTTAQLKELLLLPSVEGIEVDVERIQKGETAAMLSEITERVEQVHSSGRHPAIYTSRNELVFDSLEKRLDFGAHVSQFLMDVVRTSLPKTLGFLIAKGGITANDVLAKGLALHASRVVGQILPGCSVVLCGVTHPRHPEMPVVIFPGNVGDHHGLADVVQRLTTAKQRRIN